MESDFFKIAKKVLQLEAEALLSTSQGLSGTAFNKAVNLLFQHQGKTIVSGMGKSGHIAQKIVATFNSTGTPAVFLHPAEGVHGDLGIYSPGDPSILLSRSGSTVELLRLVPILRQFKSPIIAIVGNSNAPLAEKADIVLEVPVKEADPLGIVPTTSALTMLAVGDALASALMAARNFTEKDFARFHPAGQLGRNLLLMVQDVMHGLEAVACVEPETSLRDVVIEMTQKPLGAACILNDNHHLVGFITDGDVRRALQKYNEIGSLKADDIATRDPIFVTPKASLGEAVRLMEERPKNNQLMVLPVIDEEGKCAGLIRLHDIYQSK